MSSPDRTFLGVGLLGAAMAQAACRRGETVRVWNRTAERATALAEHGADPCPTIAEAVDGAPIVHLVLTADAAVDAVLEQAIPALHHRAVVIDHSTTSADGTVARADRLRSAGVAYLHAPVFMSPQACLDARGLMVVDGPAELLARVRPALERMTGDVLYVGDEPGSAAATKLVGNTMILTLLAGLSDAFAVGAGGGRSAAQVLDLFQRFDLSAVLLGRGGSMARGDFDPQWTLRMARKDLGLMVQAAGERPLAALPGIGARMDTLIDEQAGEDDVGVLSRDSLERGDAPGEASKD